MPKTGELIKRVGQSEGKEGTNVAECPQSARREVSQRLLRQDFLPISSGGNILRE